jgi:hypothetical protein
MNAVDCESGAMLSMGVMIAVALALDAQNGIGNAHSRYYSFAQESLCSLNS